MNTTRRVFLHNAVSPVLGLAILFSSVTVWAIDDSAASAEVPQSSDAPASTQDLGTPAKEFVSNLGQDGKTITITQVLAAKLNAELGGDGKSVVVVKFPAIAPAALTDPKGDGTIEYQHFIQVVALAELLRKNGVPFLMKMDPPPADPSTKDPQALGTARASFYAPVQRPTYSLKPKGSDCFLTEVDWSECFDQKVDYPDWYKESLSDDLYHKQAQASPPPFLKWRSLSPGTQTHTFVYR